MAAEAPSTSGRPAEESVVLNQTPFQKWLFFVKAEHRQALYPHLHPPCPRLELQFFLLSLLFTVKTSISQTVLLMC